MEMPVVPVDMHVDRVHGVVGRESRVIERSTAPAGSTGCTDCPRAYLTVWNDDWRDAARMALRGFVEKILIPPGDGLLQVVGNLGEMLTAAQGKTRGGRALGIDGYGGRI